VDRLNDRQRKFCELIVAGQTGKAAYFEAFPRCRSEKTAETESSKLLKNPKIEKFIEALRWEVGEKAKSDLVADKKELLEFLTKIIRTAPGNIDEEDPLCQSFKNTPEVREIKLPCKLRSVEQLAKLLGFYAPEKVEHEAGDTLAVLLQKIRAGQT
jgi:phage terminase small subunit